MTCFYIEVAKPAVFEIQKSSHLQPLEWPQVAASGRKWPLGQVAASGRKWPQVAASGRKWPQVAAPSEWPQVAASGRKWLLMAAWTANTSPNGPTLEDLKKKCFSRELHFFQVFCET